MSSEHNHPPEAELTAVLKDQAIIAAEGLRNSSHYHEQQARLNAGEDPEKIAGTPPIGLNLQIIAAMPEIQVLRQQREAAASHSVRATILGIAIEDGAPDFLRFLNHSLGVQCHELTVVDVDPDILASVDRLNIPQVTTRREDARHTSINSESQDFVLRDHLGNCCPPTIDRAIDQEVRRILKPGGIAIVNITTSEMLIQSLGRNVIRLPELIQTMGCPMVEQMREHVYSLEHLTSVFPGEIDHLRGELLEIEEPDSFVVFGEDEQGHGEWFRPLHDSLKTWEANGFAIIGIKDRLGTDSHQPPLQCFRHNVVLQKVR